MTRARLVLAGMRHHAAAVALVGAAVAIAAAVVTGALAVGDSVRASLEHRVRQRLGEIELAIDTGDRPFREQLALDLQAELQVPVELVVRREGVASVRGKDRRAGRVVVLGVGDSFTRLDGGTAVASVAVVRPATGTVPAWINDRLAERLDVSPGDEVTIRFERPSALPVDAAATPADAPPATLAVTIAGYANRLEDLELEATPAPPANLFVEREALQRALGWESRANLALVRGGEQTTAHAALGRLWRLDDAGIVVRALTDGRIQVESRHVFVPPAVAQMTRGMVRSPIGTPARLLTWIADAIEHRDRTVPYSMVTGVEPVRGGLLVAPPPGRALLNEWCARELGAQVGAAITLRYHAVDRADRLVQRSERFEVAGIVPMSGAVDAAMMPELPGLTDADSCRAWRTGLDVDLARIRPQDEQYWKDHRGTPKVLLAMEDARRLFGSRFGDTTALRWPAAQRPTAQVVAQELLARLDPASVGLVARDVGGAARASVEQALDFRGLFLALSAFLVAAALALAALLFGFHLERRTRELGLLAAVGYPDALIRWLVGREAKWIAVPAALAGVVLGLAYTAGLLELLSGAWSGALAGWPVRMEVRPATLVIAWTGSVAAVIAAMAVRFRVAEGATVREMLAGAAEIAEEELPDEDRDELARRRRRASRRRRRAAGGRWAIVALALGLLAAGWWGAVAMPVACLSAAMLLLVTGVLAFGAWLRRAGDRGSARPELAGLAVRGLARRPGRSQAVAGMLACGTFLLVVLESQRLAFDTDAARDAGTGGYGLWMTTTRPVGHDLASPEGRDAAGIDGRATGPLDVTPVRVLDGDDASCLNLGRAQSPRLLGVPPKRMALRTFRFASGGSWSSIDADPSSDDIPALCDVNTLTYALGRSVGDVLQYRDEQGRPVSVRIVGTLATSVLQGSVLVSDELLRHHWPVRAAPRLFLIDTALPAPAGAELERALADHGAEAVPAADVLARFAQVQNTYISIFQVLGALGLLLGSAGLGVLLAANVVERRGELALLRAVGFPARALRRLLALEHAGLFAAGLALGGVTAVLAIAPLLAAPGSAVRWSRLAALVAALAASGALWTWLATRWALRADLLSSLRRE